MRANSSIPGYGDLVRSEASAVLQRGSYWTMILGAGAGGLLLVFSALGLVRDLWVPIYWSFFTAAFSGVAYVLARFGRVTGPFMWVVVIGYTSVPTVLYVMAYFMLPSGTATYVTGPPSYGYFVVIALSGFTMQPRLALVSGAVAAVSYGIVSVAAFPALAQIRHPDPLLLQDITSPPFYFFKAIMIFFGGVMTSVLTFHARRLIERVLEKEREREGVLRTFGEYVSAEVRDRVISQKGLAERTSVAVLFCDIRGFTRLSEEFPPERVVLVLNEYLERMVQAITAQGGTIDKFVGDAIMAVFGGLLELENPCEAAVRAAVSMRSALAELNGEWERVGLGGLHNGIGIHYGEVLMGTIGSRQRKDYTVIGDVVNVAARLESQTREQGMALLVSEEVHSRLEGATAAGFRSLGTLAVKGRTGTLVVFGHP